MQKDIYTHVTNQIIHAMETSGQNWVCNWVQGGGGMINHQFKEYTGINVLLLGFAACRNNWTSNQFMTFKQALEFGANVKKGEKGTQIVFYKSWQTEKENSLGQPEPVTIPVLRSFFVFNLDQIENLPPQFAPKPFDQSIIENPVSQLADRAGATVSIRGDSAFYSPSHDMIVMPSLDRWTSKNDFEANLAHELIHWTGAKTRLDRDKKYHTMEGRAFEELVAEIGAAFLCARLGINQTPRTDHAQYLNNWLQALGNDKKFIFKAASAAQKAVDFLLSAQSFEMPIAAE